MRIGIDATSWSNWRGFGRFTRSLVRAILEIDQTNEYVLIFDSSYGHCHDLPPTGRRVIVATSRPQGYAIAPGVHRSTLDIWRMSAAVARERLDVIFLPSIDNYFPLPKRARKIIAIHDLIPETTPELTLLPRRSRILRRLKVALAIRHADRIVTGSEAMRLEIARYFQINPGRVAIIPPGAAECFHPLEQSGGHRDPEKAGSPYVLYAGGFEPHKNLLRLIAGFAKALRNQRLSSAQLVLAGCTTIGPAQSYVADLRMEIDQLGLAGRTRWVGFIGDQELAALMRGAEALILPSLKEGVGLPVIEAVACGTPVIVTSASPMAAILGEAAISIDPNDTSQIAHALEEVLGNPATRAKMHRAALALSGAMGWKRSGQAMLQILQEESMLLAASRSQRGRARTDN